MKDTTLTIKSHPMNLKDIRSFIRKAAEKHGFAKQDIDCIVLAVDEACTNIIKHAYDEDYTKDIIVSTESNKNSFSIILKDTGRKPDFHRLENPPKEKLRKGRYGVICIKKNHG